MKICILHRYPLHIINSTNPSFPFFLKRLIEKGHTVHLLTFKNEKEYFLKKDIVTHDINMPFGRQNSFEVLIKSAFFILLAPLKAYFLDKREHFDLFYCDDSFPYYEIALKMLTRKKVLIRRGDLMCAYMVDKLKFFGKLLLFPILKIEHFTWKKTDGISVITDKFRDFIVSAGVDRHKIAVIEDSIDFDKFLNKGESDALRKRYGITNEFVIMYHGVLLAIKGLDLFLKAIAIVIKKRKDIKFFIVGDGEEFQRLKKIAAELNIEPYIIFTGWVSYHDVSSYLHLCDIGVPMRKATQANDLIVTTALLQYWASSKPVIAPALNAVGDIVRDDNGFLFKPDNLQDLADTMLRAAAQKERLRDLGKTGRAFALNRFSADAIAEKMFVFIEEHGKLAQ